MIILSVVVGLFILATGLYFCEECWGAGKIVSAVITTILIFGIVVGNIWYHNNTEGGKREVKDWQSNIKGGIERVVTVYDINGKEIKKYEGKFDISYNSERIKFDDEQGKRHIIYYSTGTITIDEK